MRIVFYSDNFYPETSGISDSIIATGEELRRRGHGVLYVAPRYPPEAFVGARNADRDRLPVVRLPSIPFPNSPTGQSRIALPVGASFRAVRAFRPDVVHTQSPYGAGLEGLAVAKALHAALVGTNHTPVAEFMRYAPLRGPRTSHLMHRYESWYYNRCIVTTAPYAGLIDDMRRFGLRGDAHAQPNPLPSPPTPSRDEDRAAARQALAVAGSVVLCSGRLAAEKHVDVVLRAFARALTDVPDATLFVTGRGPAEGELQRLAESLRLGSRVRFEGLVSESALARLYAAADVYVVVSTAETQSLGLMRGFAAGVPAVVARARGLVDFTPPDAGFLVEPDDDAALAARLVELFGDDKLRRRMGAAAVHFVSAFAVESVATQWEGIFDRATHR